MRLIPRVSLRSVLRAAPACSSGGNRDAISLLGIPSSGLLSILIASLFPSLIASLFPSRPCFRPQGSRWVNRVSRGRRRTAELTVTQGRWGLSICYRKASNGFLDKALQGRTRSQCSPIPHGRDQQGLLD